MVIALRIIGTLWALFELLRLIGAIRSPRGFGIGLADLIQAILLVGAPALTLFALAENLKRRKPRAKPADESLL